MNEVSGAIDPYTDDDPEYRDTPLVSPIPLPGSSSSATTTRPRQQNTGQTSTSNDTINTLNITASSSGVNASFNISENGHQGATTTPSAPTFRKDRIISEKQSYDWLTNDKDAPNANATGIPWLKMKVEKAAPVDYGIFSIQDIFDKLAGLKTQLDTLPKHYFSQARTLANPYESIGKAVFVNRSAVKMANLDALFGFTKELVASGKPFRFADLCAGPGGFTEYLLWRLPPGHTDVRGFGITLSGDLDFNVQAFAPEARAEARFEAIYGQDGTGDVTKPENMRRFAAQIQKACGDNGVDLVTADGAFSVAGDELHQEVHSSRLIMCEVVMMFMILRKGGQFMTKVFDTCTPFMVGLFYILHRYFDKVTIIKPYTSRPANSERFVVCKGLKERRPAAIIQHLLNINKKVTELSKKAEPMSTTSHESHSLMQYKAMIEQGIELVTQIVDLDTILKDKDFEDFIEGKNTSIVMKQNQALEELLKYATDPSQPAWDQEDIRKRCLKDWDLPLVKAESASKPSTPFAAFSRRNLSSPHIKSNTTTSRHSYHPPITLSTTSSFRHRHQSDSGPSCTIPPPHLASQTRPHLADVDMNWRERDVIKKTQDRILQQNQHQDRRKSALDENWRNRT